MIVDNVEQRSLDWFRLRCGSFTGSKIGDLMKSGKKKIAAMAVDAATKKEDKQ